MWFFTKKYNLANSGLLEGFTDWHCHVLPGVDDGVGKIQESLAIIKEYESRGVSRIWLTPHVMEDIPNAPDKLRERFDELRQAYVGPVELHLAAENMLDTLFDQRLEAGEVLPIGDGGNHLLVETSYFTPPYDMDDKLQRTKSAGYFPVLAHPERYVYMELKDYDRLHADGIKMQMNLYSIFGMYGREARDKARYILKKSYYNVIGSDTHRYRQLQAALDHPGPTKKEIAALRDLPGL